MSAEPELAKTRDQQDERCTAPHPAKAFLYALPAFALVTVAVVLLWILFA